jgi:kumamolisin
MRNYIHYPKANAQGSVSWTPAELAKAYLFPKVAAGNAVIGIIELGGGYKTGDIVQAFASWDMPPPNLTNVSVDGGTNSPGGEADAEVVLDIEVAAAAYAYCTGKSAKVRVYFAGNTQNGFQDAVSRAIADNCTVISISWGAPENYWGSAAKTFDSVCATAASRGIPIFVAAGDNDSGDGEGGIHVDFPASSPHVIACGGTAKTLVSEVVWNDGNNEGTGGGYSNIFPVQSWQIGAPRGPGRMVPDIAGNADPNTGYQIFLNGQWTVIGGTSAVAPLYAGLFAALLGSGVAKTPNLNQVLWQFPVCFTDITVGNNGHWRAGVGPDPCSGLGAVIGQRLLQTLMNNHHAAPPAPQPPSQEDVLAVIEEVFWNNEQNLPFAMKLLGKTFFDSLKTDLQFHLNQLYKDK